MYTLDRFGKLNNKNLL